jgi:hypothetical protein
MKPSECAMQKRKSQHEGHDGGTLRLQILHMESLMTYLTGIITQEQADYKLDYSCPNLADSFK